MARLPEEKATIERFERTYAGELATAEYIARTAAVISSLVKPATATMSLSSQWRAIDSRPLEV